jgi:hypothetical protein
MQGLGNSGQVLPKEQHKEDSPPRIKNIAPILIKVSRTEASFLPGCATLSRDTWVSTKDLALDLLDVCP